MNVSGENAGKYFAGIDVGASSTKAVILDMDKKVLARSVIKTGSNFTTASENALDKSLSEINAERSELVYTISTGYGRNNVTIRNQSKTEISCHAKGAYFYFPEKITIIDIGGQDNKIIRLDESGKKLAFKMNRKCAAGTGAFLEEIAYRLDLPLEKLNSMAKSSTKRVEIGSFCTVFSSTEILGKIKEGEQPEDLIRGAFRSVVKRLLEMESLDGKVIITGGVVEHNPIIVDTLKEYCSVEVEVPPNPQTTGAFGAALYAIELSNEAPQ
jgi:predicted CoA-substrate-specific enzyme activase